jgi:hypothetical protein
MLVSNPISKEPAVTPHRILHVNALSTAASALAMLATRQVLYPLFGLGSPLVLDLAAVAFLAYAAALVAAARRRPVDRRTLLAFAAADALWVLGSAILLVVCWTQIGVPGRLLIVAVALVVEVFATLQFRAAGAVGSRLPEPA